MLIALIENMINVFKLWAIMVTIMVQPSELAELALHGDCAGNLIISTCLIYVMFNLILFNTSLEDAMIILLVHVNDIVYYDDYH